MRKFYLRLLSFISLCSYTHAHEDEGNIELVAEATMTKVGKSNYGTFTVPSRSKDNGMLRVKKEVDPPCLDCAITVMSANLEFLDGTTADPRNGMWMHHIVFLNKARLDGICGDKKPGQRFWGAGNERTPLDLTNGGYFSLQIPADQGKIERANLEY
jgi:hypothetical protein